MHGRAALGRSISLVIPAFNEEAGIATAIAEADEALTQLADNYEVLIVDDGSRDGTFAAATTAARNRPHVRVLRHQANRGYGAALRTGFEAARCERVAFTDADCQFDLADLGRMIPLAEQVPIVAGYRVDRQDIWRRRFMSRGYNLLTRTLLGTRVRDCDCALKVFRRDVLVHLMPNSANFFVNTEILTRARQNGFDLVEVGVRHRPRLNGQSKVSLSDVPKTLATLLPFWWSNVAFRARPGNGNRWRSGLADLALVLTVATLLFFCRLHTPLLEPEEGRYAEVPREMFDRNDWVVPTLNGAPFLDKPPLFFWGVMACYKLFGVHDWSARLAPGLAGVLTIAVAWLWARRVAGRRAALLGALTLCLSAGFVYYGRMVSMNGLLALFVTATLASGHAAVLATRRRTALWVLAGICCGLGMLSKGPLALALTLPPFFLMHVRWFRLANRAVLLSNLTHWSIFLAAAGAVAAPWYIAIMLRYPEFAGHFFWFHNVLRFAQPFDHQGPLWEYVPGFLIGMLPWALLLVPLVRDVVRRKNGVTGQRSTALGFMLLSAVWAFLFFSLAGSKRPIYLVPVFPPLALALGCYLDARLANAGFPDIWAALARCRSRVAYGATAVALVSGVGVSAITLRGGMREPIRAVVIILAAGLALAVLLTRLKSRRTNWVVAGSVAFAMLLGCFHDLLPAYAQRFSLRHSVQMHAWQAYDASAPIACYPHRWDTLAFYAGRTQLAEFSRDRRADLMRSFSHRRPTLLFVQTKYLPEVLSDLPPEFEFVARSHGDNVTIGEVRSRREAPILLAANQ